VYLREEEGSGVGLDGDVHGAGAEGTDEEPGEAAGAIDGEELEVVAGGDVEIKRFPIPGIVDAQAMPTGSDGNRDGVAVHEFIDDALTVELHHNLAKLDIIRRGATDSDLRGGISLHFRTARSDGGHDSTKTHTQDGCATILFLEEVLKGLARIVVARRGWRGGRSSLLCIGCGRGVFFDRSAKFVERALVYLVFAGNPFGNGLHAFEARGGVKVSALLAAMQLETAPRALPFRVETLLQHGAAIRTARSGNRANHARRSRPDLLLPWMAFMVLTFFFFLGLVGTLVAPMLILPVQGNLRGDAQSYSESKDASRILSEAVDNLNNR